MLLALLLLLTASPALLIVDSSSAQAQDGAHYFEETGFWVDAQFLKFWNERGGLETFGYPISRVFYQDGLHRQYFERAIFEHHEQNDPEYQVLLARLGALRTIDQRMSETGAFAPVSETDAPSETAQYFPETGHFLDGIFLDYWERHGGVMTFGYPLSEELQEPGTYDGEMRTVQYFERARMEHHPDKADEGFEVLLGHLGVESLRNRVVPDLAVMPQEATDEDRDAPPIGPQPLFDRDPVPCGYNYSFWGDAENDVTNQEYLDLMVTSGCEWIRVQFGWRAMEPDPDDGIEPYLWAYERIVDLAHERGLKILVNVTHPPDWARPDDPGIPAEPEAFASLLSRLVPRFKGKVQAWQIWNEPNLIEENNGRIDPEGYLALVRAASPAIREADPEALIVFPGLAPNSLNYDDWAIDDDVYLETLFGLENGEIAQYFDVFGAHGYGAGNSPDHYWPGNLSDNPGWTDAAEFYFRHLEEYRRILVQSGAGDMPVWITEMGWPTANSTEVYGYGEWITEELQAEYLERAFEIIRTEWPWVENAFIWHFNAAPFRGADSDFAGFSHLRADGTPRPAFHQVRELYGPLAQDEGSN